MPAEESRGRIVIAGGSGFLGISLASHLLSNGYAVDILSRTPPRAAGAWRHIPWDGRTIGSWKDALDGAHGMINLAGRSVDCIKTPDHCDEILRSRVEATRTLGTAIRTIERIPPVWVQMSTAHIYGDPEVICTEESAFGFGLAPTVGRAWEEELNRGAHPSQRTVLLRTSFVIGRNRGAGQGALGKLSLLARVGLGGTVGHGRQGMSWIHEADMNAIFYKALTCQTMSGAYIASSPFPESQKHFMAALRKAVGMPIGLPAPAWLVRLGAPLLLSTDPDLALYGRYVVPQRLLSEEFEFQFPRLAEALADLLTSD
jgi:uncharacterized protein (TIGR01777 family)